MKKYDKRTFEKHAVVSYIFNKDQVLLIKKKRGLGAGKINVPGGHIEDGESAYCAAIRETIEEVSLVTDELKLMGYLFFKFTDGLTMKGYVYRTDNFQGEPKESDEAVPFWMDIEQIPYDRMWADDIIWLPQMINGRYFRGYFEFDGDIMIKREVEFYDSLSEFNP
ncbi:8-oxo-dGTP diphosphatase [Thiospirochaeta perfilievii]|uniref:Oxidized purine nucleoside triphosphate hydrolase n=1 Tax=Thiospirochaeta perfilievii TaxID=252967 RepID=A0A5C1Q5C0_9SPIO|nr:8-oxo-dGTP diphosphatase [Thiospirochaeta perfilievii]QEN03253.1 8-oxo-dGTP diphosphatase [Thiospirochaeta perfilievii]